MAMWDTSDETSTKESSRENDSPIQWESYEENKDYFKCEWYPEDTSEEVWSTSHLDIKDRRCYASCGDGNGTTVTVNSRGHIMQISRFLGYGRSGFFIADQTNLPEPYYIRGRMYELMDRQLDHQYGLRLDLGGLVDIRDLEVSLKFAFHRWPRFVFTQKDTVKSSQPPELPQKAQEQKESPKAPESLSRGKPSDTTKLSIQYFCYQGSVFQRYLFQIDEDQRSLESLDSLKLDSEVFIGNLDFERSDSEFNGEGEDGEPHLGPDQRGLIILHTISPDMATQMGIQESEYRKTSGPKAAALIITPFAHGSAQKVKKDGSIMLDENVKTKFMETGQIDVTVGYRIQLLEEHQKWKHSMAPAAHLLCMGKAFSGSNPVKRIRFSRDDRFDFLIQRNLEHTLSVCCIPIPESPTLGSPGTMKEAFGDDGAAEGGDNKGMPPMPVAITCGDVSEHFIGRRASFSIFQFLCSMLTFLSPKDSCHQQYLEEPSDCKCGDLAGGMEICDACDNIRGYCSNLGRRIRVVLEGHVSWICTKTQPLDDGRFSPHYWPTGEYIERWDWLPPPSLIDTPLQMLKLFWLYRLDLDNEKRNEKGISIPDWIWTTSLWAKILSWISSLDKCNRRGSQAFQEQWTEEVRKTHLIRDPWDKEAKFRLTDHVMICLALKCVERLGGLNFDLGSLTLSGLIGSSGYGFGRHDLENATQRVLKDGVNSYIERFEGGEASEVYSYERVRRKVLKRFTVEGPPSDQRMFATCRTPTRIRFLFHAKDVFLFDAMNVGFFQEGDKRPTTLTKHRDNKNSKKKRSPKESEQVWGYTDSRWKATVDAQSSYNEYRYLEWETPLWYALTFILGCHRTRINERSIEGNLKASAKALLDQSFPSGLLPGLLDENQEPISFDHEAKRDCYWNATFETLYVLWTHGKDYFDLHITREKANIAPETNPAYTGDTVINTASKGDVARTGQLLTKTIPFVGFDSLIDQKRLVAVSDDWLQDEPAVLGFLFTPEFSPTEVYQAQFLRKQSDDEENDEGPLISAAAKNFFRPSSIDRTRDTIIDVPKKGFYSRDPEPSYKTNMEMMKSLMEHRTLLNAKKRIVWLPHGDGETALLCYLASPQPEKDNMLQFFGRHSCHDKYFFDSATSALNEWETELHLSFFGRPKPECKSRRDFLERVTGKISEPSFLEICSNNGNGEKETEFLFQETMSFRFVGDFSDHFWTCHSLVGHFSDHVCTCQSSGMSHETPDKELVQRLKKLLHETEKDEDRYKKAWQQRKVLELLLFNAMLERIYANTKDILDWVEDQVLRPPDLTILQDPSWRGIKVTDLSQYQSSVTASFPLNILADAIHDAQLLQTATSDNYFDIVSKWRMCQQILQAIEDDLSGNIETINQWNRREEERGSQQPRWTRKDEKSYREPIARLTILNQRKARDIERLRASIEAFRESLPSQLGSVRDDISFRGSENINLFTYVTVIFLPLGFATGIFSMNDPPKHSTLVGMVELALVALALTVFALANAKTTGKVPVKLVIWAFRCINNLFLLLVVWFWNQVIFLYWYCFRITRSNGPQANNEIPLERAPRTKRVSNFLTSVLNSDLNKQLEFALKDDPRAKARKHEQNRKGIPEKPRIEVGGADGDGEHACSTGWCPPRLWKSHGRSKPGDEENGRRTGQATRRWAIFQR